MATAEHATPPREPAPFLRKGSLEFRKASIALFLSGYATFSLLYCVQPLMPLFSAEFGVTPAQSSLSLSLSTGFLAFSIFFAAAVSERFGRKSLMFVSLLGSALCALACAVAPGWPALLAIRALQGLLLGGVPAVAMAYLAEEIEPRGLGASMGLYIAGNAFGGMAGRVVAGILAELFSWKVALAGIGAIGLAATAGFAFLLPASRHFAPRQGMGTRFHLEAWAGHLADRGLLSLFAVSFAVMGAFVTIYNYIGFRLMAEPYHLSQTTLGLMFTVYLFGIVASFAAGRLGDRFGHFMVLQIALAIEAAGILLTLASALGVIVTGMILLTIGFFASHSVASALVGRMARSRKGHASSLYLLAYYLGSSLAGSAGGYVWFHDGWAAIVLFTVALLIAAMAAAFIARTARRPS